MGAGEPPTWWRVRLTLTLLMTPTGAEGTTRPGDMSDWPWPSGWPSQRGEVERDPHENCSLRSWGPITFLGFFFSTSTLPVLKLKPRASHASDKCFYHWATSPAWTLKHLSKNAHVFRSQTAQHHMTKSVLPATLPVSLHESMVVFGEYPPKVLILKAEGK